MLLVFSKLLALSHWGKLLNVQKKTFYRFLPIGWFYSGKLQQQIKSSTAKPTQQPSIVQKSPHLHLQLMHMLFHSQWHERQKAECANRRAAKPSIKFNQLQ